MKGKPGICRSNKGLSQQETQVLPIDEETEPSMVLIPAFPGQRRSLAHRDLEANVPCLRRVLVSEASTLGFG